MRRLLKNRKAYSFADIPWIAVILGVGIITLSIMTEITGQIKDDTKKSETTSITNETVTLSSLVGKLSQAGLYIGFSSCMNETRGVTVEIGLYCNISSDGIVKVSSTNFSASSDALIAYTHYTPTYEYNITVAGLRGELKLADWFPVVGLVLGAIIVITALTILFTMRFKKT